MSAESLRAASAIGEAIRRFMLRPESTALVAVVVLFIIFTILSPKLFPYQATFVSLMSVAAELGIVSIGVTLLMIGGHFDLSVGAVLGLTSYVAVVLMRDFGLSPLIAAPAAIAVGALLGFVNGALVVRFRIHSFVVTLGMMLIWRGVLIALTGGFPMTVDIPAGVQGGDVGAAPRRLPHVDAVVLPDRRGGDVPAFPHPVRQLDPGRRPEPAGRAQSRRPGRSRHHHPVHDHIGARRGHRRHPGGALLVGRCAARRRHRTAGRRGDGHRRHASLRRLWQRHRHDPRGRSRSA